MAKCRSICGALTTRGVAYVDLGYASANAAQAAANHGIQLEVAKHTEAKRGFVRLPRRWVVERSFAWAARFRRPAKDYERLVSTLAASHLSAFCHPHARCASQNFYSKLIIGVSNT
jgi:transposase